MGCASSACVRSLRLSRPPVPSLVTVCWSWKFKEGDRFKATKHFLSFPSRKEKVGSGTTSTRDIMPGL